MDPRGNLAHGVPPRPCWQRSTARRRSLACAAGARGVECTENRWPSRPRSGQWRIPQACAPADELPTVTLGIGHGRLDFLAGCRGRASAPSAFQFSPVRPRPGAREEGTTGTPSVEDAPVGWSAAASLLRTLSRPGAPGEGRSEPNQVHRHRGQVVAIVDRVVEPAEVEPEPALQCDRPQARGLHGVQERVGAADSRRLARRSGPSSKARSTSNGRVPPSSAIRTRSRSARAAKARRASAASVGAGSVATAAGAGRGRGRARS